MNQQHYDYEINEQGEASGRSLPGMAAAERAAFLSKTYLHLLAAILGFVAIEVALFQSGAAEKIATTLLAGGQTGWLLVLGGFMLVGFLANRFALGAESLGAQYFGLGIYVVAQAIIFVPLLFVANTYAPGVIENSAIITLVGFTALSMIVFITRADFSWMRSILMWAGFAALGFIVVGAFMGWSGGSLFPALMIAFAGAYILYDTSNVLHHYPENRYVGAALALFSSVALMFWYVISFFLSRE